MSAPIISYAQNQEDVILHCALREVGQGFYIDVGAQHPVVDSVTKLFYEQGWRGINIDPMPQWVSLLQADRPRDINLQMAAGAQRGQMSFFAIPDTGLSTASAEFAALHAKLGFATEPITVEVRTLDEICDLHGVREVHFLKIDVEGAEEDVIRGFSFSRIRPWIVVVEAIEPVNLGDRDSHSGALKAVPTHATWEPLLLAHGYEFVYWDGLNRFYLAREHEELRSRFGVPPNPLDEFLRHVEQAGREQVAQLEAERQQFADAAAPARNQIAALEQQLAGLRNELNQRTQHQAHLEQALARHQADLQNILRSRSWRVTRPLRWLARQLRGLRGLARRIVRRLLLTGLHFVQKHPGARQMVKRVLALAPARVRNRLAVFARFHSPHAQSGIPVSTVAAAVSTLQGAGIQTQAIHSRLRRMAASAEACR